MSKYKVIKMRTTGGVVYTVNRVDGNELIPVIPIKYFKTRAGAARDIKRRNLDKWKDQK